MERRLGADFLTYVAGTDCSEGGLLGAPPCRDPHLWNLRYIAPQCSFQPAVTAMPKTYLQNRAVTNGMPPRDANSYNFLVLLLDFLSICLWVKFQPGLTVIQGAHLGMIPLANHDSSEGEQCGRYNLPRYYMYYYIYIYNYILYNIIYRRKPMSLADPGNPDFPMIYPMKSYDISYWIWMPSRNPAAPWLLQLRSHVIGILREGFQLPWSLLQ